MKIKSLLLSATILGALLPVSAAQAQGWKQAGDFLVRGRIIGVIPNEDQDVTPIGGSVDINNSINPELDFTYFFTDHIAAELILGSPPHEVKLHNSSVGDVDLGDVWLLPPTLTLQYHFDPLGSWAISPYLGAGINYTWFYGEDVSSPINSADYGSSFGGALQAGADIPLTGNWFFNVDAKYVWINTDVNYETAIGHVDADVDINPLILGVGIGYKF